MYSAPNRTVSWHDKTVGWIASQELMKTPNQVTVSNLSDFAQSVQLDLDAETITNIKDLKYFSNLEDLSLNVNNIRNLDMLRHLDKLNRLVLINGNRKTLKYLKNLNVSTLILKNFTLSSIEPLTEMCGLSRLEITDTFIEDSASFKNLSDLPYLSLVNVSSDSGISLCKAGNYKEINLSNVEINNLGSISRCTGLSSLGLENINLADGEELELPHSLKNVALKDCRLTNLKMFLSLPNLTTLDVADNQIQDINDLASFENLEELSLANNPIHDLSPIQSLKSIKKLNLSGISHDNKTLDLLSKMSFDELSVSNCNITDLSFLKGHGEIKKLDISHNAVEDIGILKMYRKGLESLNISWNPISDLSPLKDWVFSGIIYIYYPSFKGVELDVSGINLGKIDDEKGMAVVQDLVVGRLTARNCGLKNVDIVRSQMQLRYLDISDNPLNDISIITLDGLPFLEDVIAKETSPSKVNVPFYGLYNGFLYLLTPPGTYGISSFYKGGFSPTLIDTSKRAWIKLVIE